MANRNNSGRTKKSHGYKPYDSSNSFVKRITDKVSEILPQPTSWVSRWFSPASKLNTRSREELEEDDEEEEERQPPSKRLCFGPPDSNDYTHQNNINRLTLDQDSGEISPISSRQDDRAVAGPSGLHLKHFVSSTPAVHQTTSSLAKIAFGGKARDDASEQSETTSGCSSLVPGRESPHSQRDHLSTPVGSPNIQNISSMGRLSTNTLRAKSLLNRSNTMNLSTSSQPAFDTFVFNNPLNRSGIRRKSIADDSCFYPGQTTFGGSSSRLSAPVDPPRVVSVKPSPSREVQQDTIGTSAMRILKALEQFSTPVLDAKRIPLRSPATERKRKPPQPYEELIYPSMPDLLRVKRREQQYKRMQQSVERKVEASPHSTCKPNVASKSSTSIPAPSTPHMPLTTASSATTSISTLQPQYSFRSDNLNERHVGCIKGRSKDDELELERVPEVNLPNVKLQLSKMPKFDLDVPSLHQNVPKHQSKATPKSPPFKFSEPEEITIKPLRESNVLPINTFKFSEPLEPMELNKKSSESSLSSKTQKDQPPQLQMKNPSPNLKLKRKSSASGTLSANLTDVKPITEMKNASVMEVLSKKPFGDSSTKLTLDSTCSKCNSKNIVGGKCSCEKSNSVLSNEGSGNNMSTWECKKCSLANSTTESKCKSCSADKNGRSSSTGIKGFVGFKKPTDTWECKSCLVNNNNTLDSCAACSTPKLEKKSNEDKKPTSGSSLIKPSDSKVNDIGAKPPIDPTSLFNSIKKPEGSWECTTCLVRNKKDDDKCVACSTLKPGCSSSTSENPKPFCFGITPSTTSSETKLFNSVPKTDSQPKFTFGLPPSDNISTISSISTKEAVQRSENLTAELSSIGSANSSSKPTPLINSIKKEEGSWQCSTCLVQNKKDSTNCVACTTLKPGAKPSENPKPSFSFGFVPNSTDSVNSSSLSTNVTKDSSTTANKPLFTFGNPSDDKKTQFTFGNLSSDDKKTTSLFNAPTTELKVSNDVKTLNFTNSDDSKNKESTKPPSSNLFTFGAANKETKNEELNDESENKPAKKKVSFGTPLSFEKPLSNDSSSNSAPFGNLSNKANDLTSSFSFAGKTNVTAIQNDTVQSLNTNALFTFGNSSKETSKAGDLTNTSESSKPVSFGTLSAEKPLPTSTGIPNTNNIFSSNTSVFKAPVTENKPFPSIASIQPSQNQQGGFSFNPPTAPSADFSSQPNQVNASPAPSLFGQQSSPAPSLFGQQQTLQAPSLFSQPSQEQKPFVFGASNQQQQGPVFTFNAAPTQPTGGLGSGTPSFGSFTAPTPKFDPNIKPSFNFTGGATPSFSATPSNALSDVNSDNKRIMRKAIRRTTQNR